MTGVERERKREDWCKFMCEGGKERDRTGVNVCVKESGERQDWCREREDWCKFMCEGGKERDRETGLV